MAGVLSSDEIIPNRIWYHDVSLDGVPQSSMVAMRAIMERLSSLEQRVGSESALGKEARRRRADEDLRESALHVQPVVPPLASHRGLGSLPAPAPGPRGFSSLENKK